MNYLSFGCPQFIFKLKFIPWKISFFLAIARKQLLHWQWLFFFFHGFNLFYSFRETCFVLFSFSSLCLGNIFIFSQRGLLNAQPWRQLSGSCWYCDQLPPLLWQYYQCHTNTICYKQKHDVQNNQNIPLTQTQWFLDRFALLLWQYYHYHTNTDMRFVKKFRRPNLWTKNFTH